MVCLFACRGFIGLCKKLSDAMKQIMLGLQWFDRYNWWDIGNEDECNEVESCILTFRKER